VFSIDTLPELLVQTFMDERIYLFWGTYSLLQALWPRISLDRILHKCTRAACSFANNHNPINRCQSTHSRKMSTLRSLISMKTLLMTSNKIINTAAAQYLWLPGEIIVQGHCKGKDPIKWFSTKINTAGSSASSGRRPKRRLVCEYHPGHDDW